ncbi:MAG TPA: hypothetical protein PLG20_04650 [Candidatus Syntrophosphaera sp.]|jgi:hypothetical protein|nr:hypothetical protein [Candidatus Syntrophosphaera sp.]
MIKRLVLLFLALSPFLAYAATGCDLNDPDRDVKRLFPTSTGYKTSYASIQKSGGKATLAAVEKALGDKFGGLYETIDAPYTIYTIYKGNSVIGYVHGVNQKGAYGGLQVFLALDTKGKITGFYYQKLSSKNAAKFKAAAFANQFTGLSLADFATLDIKTGKGTGKAALIKNPSTATDKDFLNTLRGVKKNLVLMNVFIYNK